MDPLMHTSGMTDAQRMMFLSEFNARRKDRTAALLLTLFLGGLGAHRFYMGQVGWGVLYLVFCWTFIPVCISLVELFLIGGRVDRHNEQTAMELAAKVKMLMPAASV